MPLPIILKTRKIRKAIYILCDSKRINSKIQNKDKNTSHTVFVDD